MVVVSDEDSQATRSICTERVTGAVRDSKGYLDPESAAHCYGADDANFTAHQFNKSARDRQTQPGTAKATGRGRIGLSEWRKQTLERRRLDAYAGILHRAAQTDPIGTLLRAEYLQLHVAGCGELNRIAQQVGENLAQARRIAVDHARQAGRRLNDQLDPLRHRLRGQHLAEVPHELLQIGGFVLERHLAS